MISCSLGAPFRMLTVVDQFSRQNSLIARRSGFDDRDVAAALDPDVERTVVPMPITVDRGTKFTSKVLQEWACQRRVKRDLTHPEKPTDHGHIASFNARLRDECLSVGKFTSLDCARGQVEFGEWIEAHTVRPAHSATSHRLSMRSCISVLGLRKRRNPNRGLPTPMGPRAVDREY